MSLLKRINLILAMSLFQCPGIIRVGGVSSNPKIEIQTYTGTYSQIDDGDRNTRVKFLTSGTLVLKKSVTVDVFLVGGGGSGATVNGDDGEHRGGGGGSGRTGTWSSIYLQAGVSYSIVVGAGGAQTDATTGNMGGTTSAFTYSINGGNGGNGSNGGSGSSGGGATEKIGGSNGSNGTNSTYYTGGTGQGTTTREFGESSGDLYAGAGAGYACFTQAPGGGGYGAGRYYAYGAGVANTGGGGCGGMTGAYAAAAGGSGIVVIRNHRAVA